MAEIDNHNETNQAGMAYAGILFLLLILTTMGLAFLHKVGTEMSVTETRGQTMQAHYLAEAAVNHAMWRLLNEPASEGDIRIAHVNDDAQEKTDNSMELHLNKHELGKKPYQGLRFLNVRIPQGATVTYAHVEFKASDNNNQVTDVQIRGEDEDNAARFNGIDNNISTRSQTASVVTWNTIEDWTKDESYQTPDLSSVIQDVVNRAGWSSGNALALIFKSTDLSGERRAYTYDSSPSSAPLLHVVYDDGGIASANVYYMHSLAGGRYGYKVRRHTDTTFATVATVGAVGDHVVHQSYVLYVKPDPALETCQAEYVEMYQPWTPPIRDSWQVVDLSIGPFYVPAGAVVEVAMTNTADGNEREAGVRAVGSKLNRRIKIHEAEDGGVDALVMHVQADANSQIEYNAKEVTDIEFVFLGYWTCARYVETFVSFNAVGSGAWETHDLATYGIGANQVAEVVIDNTKDNKHYLAGVRKVGSGLDRTVDHHEPEGGGEDVSTMLVETGGDDNATVEIYAGQKVDIDFFIMGYWSTPPGTYTELSDVLGSPLTDQAWEDLDLSGFGVPASAVAQIAAVNQYELDENRLGLREKGSSLDRTLELQEAEDGGGDIATVHVNVDENSMIEWYHEDVSESHEYRLVGYWQCADTVGTDLVGHWKLDEDSGTTASDSSTRGNDGTLTNMDPATDWVSGKLANALDFDGGDDHVLVPHDPSLSLMHELTVAAWIYANTGGLVDYDLVFNKGTSGDNRNYWFGTKDDKISFGFYDGGTRKFEFDPDLQTETWYHIAATFNNAGDSVRVYLNGAEVDSWSTGDEPLTNTEDLYIGRSQYAGEYWDGTLDDVRIYNRVLEQTEIQALYDAAF